MDTQVADLLGGERVLGASVKSNLDLARATRKGLPAETAVQLVAAIRGADAEGEARRLGIKSIDLRAMGPLGSLIGSLRDTANRRNTGDAKLNIAPARLTPEQSKIVIRTARTLAKAIDTLGDTRKAAHWLTTPNRALGGEIPINLLDTSAGAHEVETVLDRVEYGVYS
ncbi:putative Toxin-antitoxin system antitoxin component family [Candidatus Sulfopaludibacter sp. SbA6]|nr:putative Toxin-antitoxin system antitoxin component family [Candidatus Sulfopaludibacter sp. SbA6]